MCKPSIPDPPPPPPAPPSFDDENIALGRQVEQDRSKQIFAGLNSTIKNTAAGVLSKTRTTKGIK